MKQDNKRLIIKYLVYFGIACMLMLMVFAIRGFFGDSASVNLQVLADGFFVSGLLMTLFAGLLFVSSEGALIGIGFIMRSVVLTFIPMGRMKHELYADYRERKMSELKKLKDHCALFVGLFFLAIGVILTIVWYVKFYNVPA